MVVTEPQVWVLIGVFAAIMLGGFTLTTTLLLRAMRSGFDAVDAKFDAVDARFDAVSARFDAMDAKFDAKLDAVNVTLGHLDRDVSALMRHTFGISE